MKPAVKNNLMRINSLFSRLAAEKKKTVCALCLIVLMVFMWTRVLLNKETQSVVAAPQILQSSQNRTNSQLKITFIELPNIKGRNDVLTTDFFNVGNWRDFIRRGKNQNLVGIERVNVISTDGGEEIARLIAEKLRLEAISLSKNPQAFINNKLLAVGDKLSVIDGVNTYECEVVNIEENKVLIRCGNMKIRLKLTQTSSFDY